MRRRTGGGKRLAFTDSVAGSTIGGPPPLDAAVTAVRLALLAVLLPAAASAGDLDRVRAEAEELLAAYRADLTTLAERADAAGEYVFGEELRTAAAPPDPAAVFVTPPPRAVRTDLPNDLPPDELKLRKEARRLGEEFADAAFGLARRAATGSAAEPGAAGVAFGLARDALAAFPDHAPSRRAVGQTRDGDRWITPWERGMERRRYVDHPEHGWVPTAHVERLDAGERMLDGRWVDRDREALVRADFARGWVCETEHYRVKTNVSRERGVEVARQLERFHAFFRGVFPAFGLGPADLKSRFAGSGRVPTYRNAGGAGGKYNVHLYRDKAEYVLALRAKIPQIAITNGLYFNGDRVAYFFERGEGASPVAVLHEATHQLFYECTPRQRYVAEDAHFWALEGIGCYMESFRDDGLTMTAGSPRYQRFYNAKRRIESERLYFFVPLAEFDDRGRARFQTDPDLSKCYSQASGLTHFFMHAAGGAYRAALSEHLSDLYHPLIRPANVRSLDRLTGVPWGELGERYRAYIADLGEG